MDEQDEQTPEQKLDELEPTVTTQLAKALSEYVEKNINHGSEMRVRSLTSVATFYAIRRQEKLLAAMNRQSDAMTCHLAAMKKQSNAMTWHSWIMIALTVVILVATITQVKFLISNKQSSTIVDSGNPVGNELPTLQPKIPRAINSTPYMIGK